MKIYIAIAFFIVALSAIQLVFISSIAHAQTGFSITYSPTKDTKANLLYRENIHTMYQFSTHFANIKKGDNFNTRFGKTIIKTYVAFLGGISIHEGEHARRARKAGFITDIEINLNLTGMTTYSWIKKGPSTATRAKISAGGLDAQNSTAEDTRSSVNPSSTSASVQPLAMSPLRISP